MNKKGSNSKKRERLDQLLVQKEMASDLKKAGALLLSGKIKVDGVAIPQVGTLINPEAEIIHELPAPYVSRGGEKLAGALRAFKISVTDRLCFDIGSSTGGFTDCLLKNGAKRVWAVDVGHGLLDEKLRKDGRVVVLEGVNIRHFEISTLAEKPSLITVDVSFISVEKIFPKMKEILAPNGEIVVMVKPQFEGTGPQVPGGIVKDEDTRQSILKQVRQSAIDFGFTIKNAEDSVLDGRKGNREHFLHLVLND